MSPSARTPAMRGDPWGARARDWAEIEDEGSRELFERVLDLADVGEGSRFLDVGCGSGLACAIAASRGAAVSGIDSSEGLLGIARERTPAGDFRLGDMVSLPWADDTFDAVAFVNTLFFASDQDAAMREAARVARPGGRVAAVGWTSPERVQAAAYLGALGPLLTPMPMEVNPFIEPRRLEELARGAGLEPGGVVDLDWPWRYPDVDTALRGWMSAGLSTAAIEASGEAAVRQALTTALEGFTTPSGEVKLENAVHCMVATA